jgi:hypothetical protein
LINLLGVGSSAFQSNHARIRSDGVKAIRPPKIISFIKMPRATIMRGRVANKHPYKTNPNGNRIPMRILSVTVIRGKNESDEKANNRRQAALRLGIAASLWTWSPPGPA